MPTDTFPLAGHPVRRVGFGAMQLPGPGVFGPPRDRDQALAVLRRAVDAGVNHIDTAQFYGPGVANDLIHEALFPYPEDLVLVSKVGASRDDQGGWTPAQEPAQLRAGVVDNLRSLEIEQLPVVNLRRLPGRDVPFEDQVEALVSMREEGLIEGLGLSNVSLEEYRQARSSTRIECVQNAFSVADRSDQPLLDACREDGAAYVPFFPLGSAFSTVNPVLDAAAVRSTAERLGATPAQVALAWLLALAPHVLLIPGTSSPAHLDENLAVARIELDRQAMADLDVVPQTGGPPEHA